jgi:hypothetical protein
MSLAISSGSMGHACGFAAAQYHIGRHQEKRMFSAGETILPAVLRTLAAL